MQLIYSYLRSDTFLLSKERHHSVVKPILFLESNLSLNLSLSDTTLLKLLSEQKSSDKYSLNTLGYSGNFTLQFESGIT